MPPRLAVDAARRLLAQPPGNVSTVRVVAERCRQVGAVDLAAALYGRLTEAGETDAATVAAAEILGGAPPRPDYPEGTPVPVPVIRYVDFLPEAEHEKVLGLTRQRISSFQPSEVYADGHGRLDPSQRISAILHGDGDHRALFLPIMETLLKDESIWFRLGLTPSDAGLRELQVTCSAAGAFFKAHSDSGKGKFEGRKLTYVYYFNFAPKRFTGGDLKVYDRITGSPGASKNHYSLFEPVDNTMVLFPSSAIHEVMPVECGQDLMDGRFTINGWFH